jgi:branched-chain amino acid transport system substrate-binding protein
MLIGSAVEIARLGQIAREVDPSITLLGDTSDEMLLKIGGKSLDRYVATQPFNRDDTSPKFRTFAKRYEVRYKQPLGFTALVSYDAGTAIMEALRRREGNETLQTALIRNSPYLGVQGEVAFDKFGDAHRSSQLVTITNGAFQVLR